MSQQVSDLWPDLYTYPYDSEVSIPCISLILSLHGEEY